MATHRIPILGANAKPDATGSVYPVPFSQLATNDATDPLVWAFADTATKIGLHFSFNVPKNYVGTGKFILVWSSSVITGDVVWDVDYRGITGNDSEGLDQAGFQESVTGTDVAPTAAHRRLECAISITSANLAADDTVRVIVSRDGASADTLAGIAYLETVLFEYADA